MGTPLPSPKKGGHSTPNFSPCLLWPNGWLVQDETWHRGRPQSRPHCLRWGPSSPSPKGAEPPILAHVYCCQTAGTIRMPLGMEVVLGPNQIMLDGDPAPPKMGQSPPILTHVCCGEVAGWIKMPLGSWYGGRSHPTRHCVRWEPISPKKGPPQPSTFPPISIVAKRMGGSGYHLVLWYALVSHAMLDGDPAPPMERGTVAP